MIRRLQVLLRLLVFQFFRIVALFSRKDHWVICERGTDAADNGYCFYQYLKAHHPGQKVYYIITADSPDYHKVKDDAVIWGSFRNYYLVATARKVISTHYATALPLHYSARAFRLCGLPRKFYFLQHGVIAARVPLSMKSAPMQLFVCGGYPEYEFVRQAFGHEPGVVQYTGLARFDLWQRATARREILVMPTWRAYLRSREEFEHSQFFRAWQQFLSDPALAQILEQEQVQLFFYPHKEMEPYLHFFNSPCKNVTFLSSQNADIQALIAGCGLLITDYSSVHFDFGYMKKPVLYYCFDDDAFYRHHYPKGYFDMDTMGFGDVCQTRSQLLSRLSALLKGQMQMPPHFHQRAEAFFPLHDGNNCLRIYQAINGGTT